MGKATDPKKLRWKQIKLFPTHHGNTSAHSSWLETTSKLEEVTKIKTSNFLFSVIIAPLSSQMLEHY